MGKDISSWEELQSAIANSQGKTLAMKVKRDGEILDINVTPKPFSEKNIFGEETRAFKIGVTLLPFDTIPFTKR